MEPRREGDGRAVEAGAGRGEQLEAVEHLGQVQPVVVARAVPGGEQLVAQVVVVGQRPALGEAHACAVSCWSARARSCPEDIAQRMVRVPTWPSTRLVSGGTGGSRSSRLASVGSSPIAAAASDR